MFAVRTPTRVVIDERHAEGCAVPVAQDVLEMRGWVQHHEGTPLVPLNFPTLVQVHALEHAGHVVLVNLSEHVMNSVNWRSPQFQNREKEEEEEEEEEKQERRKKRKKEERKNEKERKKEREENDNAPPAPSTRSVISSSFFLSV